MLHAPYYNWPAATFIHDSYPKLFSPSIRPIDYSYIWLISHLLVAFNGTDRNRLDRLEG